MDLPPLASVAALEHAMQVAPGSLDVAQAELALRRASARVRRYTGQIFTLVENETVLLRGGERVLVLPQRPVVVDAEHPLGVAEIPDWGGVEVACIEDRDFTRLGAELTRGYPWYNTSRLAGWPWRRVQGVWAPRVRVTYSHGEEDEDVPEDVTDIVLDLGTMNMVNPRGLREESVAIDDFSRSQTYATETIGNARLTSAHKADLRPYKRGAFSVRPS